MVSKVTGKNNSAKSGVRMKEDQAGEKRNKSKKPRPVLFMAYERKGRFIRKKKQ